MDTKKQNTKEPKDTAAPASKTPANPKPGGEQAPRSMNQSSSANQVSSSKGTTGQQTGEEDLLKHAKHATGEIVNKVQERAGSQINRQKETAATEISQVANAVRRIRESLPGGEESGALARFASEYGDKAANSLDRLSNYIREQEPRQLLDDVQNFGRRRPALLLGGAFLLGFAGARLIKSSMDAASSSMQMGYRQRSSPMNTRGSDYTGTNVAASRQPNPNAI